MQWPVTKQVGHPKQFWQCQHAQTSQAPQDNPRLSALPHRNLPLRKAKAMPPACSQYIDISAGPCCFYAQNCVGVDRAHPYYIHYVVTAVAVPTSFSDPSLPAPPNDRYAQLLSTVSETSDCGSCGESLRLHQDAISEHGSRLHPIGFVRIHSPVLDGSVRRILVSQATGDRQLGELKHSECASSLPPQQNSGILLLRCLSRKTRQAKTDNSSANTGTGTAPHFIPYLRSYLNLVA